MLKKDVYSSSWNLRATERHLPYGSHSVTCHPTQVSAPCLNPSHAGRYSIYLPLRDGRLSWPCYLETQPPGVELATSRSRIQCPNHWATKQHIMLMMLARVTRRQYCGYHVHHHHHHHHHRWIKGQTITRPLCLLRLLFMSPTTFTDAPSCLPSVCDTASLLLPLPIYQFSETAPSPNIWTFPGA